MKFSLLRSLGVLCLAATSYASSIDRVQVLDTNGGVQWDYLVAQGLDSTFAAGDYFTLYDVHGFTGAVSFHDGAAGNWEYVDNLDVPDRPAFVMDDPSVPNVSFRYSGASTTDLLLGFFRIDAPFIDPLLFGIRYTRSSDGQSVTDFGLVRSAIEDPGLTASAPEPASVVLAASALACTALLKRRLRKPARS